jgi:hypothetical protein
VLATAGWLAISNNTDLEVQTQTEQAEVEQNDETQITYAATAGKTALEQLLELNDTVVTQEASYGTYVDSINGLKGGENGAYWIFFVNGEMASVGADAYIAEGGELIEWKYQE